MNDHRSGGVIAERHDPYPPITPLSEAIACAAERQKEIWRLAIDSPLSDHAFVSDDHTGHSRDCPLAD